jgi:hypothetical protein
VIQKGKNSSDEDDGGKHLKGEDEAEGRFRFAEVAEYKLGAEERETQQFIRSPSRELEDGAADRESQDEESEGKLKAEAPQDRFQADGFAIR